MGKEASFADMILLTSHVSLFRRTPLAAFFNRPLSDVLLLSGSPVSAETGTFGSILYFRINPA
jgi:hypothetical protein